MTRVVTFGLNRVDRYAADYGGWEGALSGCCGDAAAIVTAGARAGAEATGYMADYFGTRTTFGSTAPDYRLVGDATRDNLRKTFQEIALSNGGDTWIIWYSGHGAQVIYPFDTVESLCLFDGLLADRELWKLFQQVPFGVHVLFGADACHAGGLPGTRFVGPYHQVKACPLKFIGRDTPGLATRSGLAGNLCFWAGCQKGQLSMDGPHNGLFTATALSVVQPGMTYAQWGGEVRRKMPDTQQPEMIFYGDPSHWDNPVFT